jgi:hypothetical protein
MNTPNHQTARQQLWCNIATAVASDPLVEDTSTPVDWADHILKAFDERFPGSPAPEPEIPEGLPPLPPVPEGYDRWVYRGTGWNTKGVDVVFGFHTVGEVWDVEEGVPSGSSLHYIEAVKGGDQ